MNHNKCTGPPDEPTDAIPGSEEKIKVLEKRAMLGQSLFHPQDRTNRKKRIR